MLTQLLSAISGNQQSKNQYVFWVIGDSIAGGRGESVGPTPAAGTVKEWNGTSLVNITNSDVSTAQDGSPWPKFGIDFYAKKSKTIILSCDGYGGSEFYPNGDNLNWYNTGILYSPAKTKLDNLLTHLNITTIDGVLLILGINDARGSQTIANIRVGMDDLVSRINSDFNTPPIYLAQIGREEAGDTQRVLDVRSEIDDLVLDNANVYMSYDEMPNFTSYGWMQDDNLHPTQEGNNDIGRGFADYIN